MNVWNERYSGTEWAFGTEPNDFLREFAQTIPPGRVLCLGEGEGRNAVYLAGLGYAVTALDISPVGLAKARELAQARGVTIETEVADLADYVPLPGVWQGIVSIFCHLPASLRQTLYPALTAGLATGGVLLLEAYTPAQIGRGTGGPGNADLLPTADALCSAFPGLALERLLEREREVCEGRLHTGTANVVQLIGRKLP